MLNDITKGNAIRQLSVHIHGSGAPMLPLETDAADSSEGRASRHEAGGGGAAVPWKMVSISTGPEGIAEFRTSLQCIYTALPSEVMLPGKL